MALSLSSIKHMYNKKWDSLYKLESDIDVISNQIRVALNSTCQIFSSLAQPKDELDHQMKEVVDCAHFDYNIINKVEENSDMLNWVEKKIVFSILQSIKDNTNKIIANYGQISNHGIHILAEGLKHSDTVLKVDLSCNIFGAPGCESLGAMLNANLYMQTLKLSSNKLDDKWVEYIVDGLKFNKGLKHLYLSDNMITWVGAKTIAKLMSIQSKKGDGAASSIETLALDKNIIKEDGAMSIAKMIKVNNKLINLYLNDNEINNRGVIALCHAIEDNLSIDLLTIYANELTKEIQILVKKKFGDRVCMSNTLF